MNFSTALQHLKDGKRLKRSGWNATDQYVYHVPAASYPAVTDIAKREFGLKSSSVGPNNEIMVPYTAYLAIKTVQNTVAPWLASQTDLLAEDWEVIDDEA